MTVKLKRFKPRAVPETRMAPVNGCRMSTLVIARKYETLGEQFIRGNGKPYSPEDDESVMRWLRRLAARDRGETPQTAKGFSRANALYAYTTAFPTGNPISADITPAEMWDLLKDGWFLSVSGNVDDVPSGSKLDDYVNDVAHEIGIAPFPDSKDRVTVYEPMTPIARSPIEVDWVALRRFSSEFATNRRRLCIRFKAGYDTAANRVRRENKDTISRIRTQRNQALATIARHAITIDNLQDQLAECEATDPDDAAREALLDALHEWETEQRL